LLIDYLSEPEPIGSSGVRHQLGNFSLQLLVTKGGKRTSTKEVTSKRFLVPKGGNEGLLKRKRFKF